MRNNIRRPLFGGMREIHAIWFDLAVIGEAQARKRVLTHWRPGARLHRAGGGYLLTLAKARMDNCDTLDGLALCKVDGILSSAPLAADEKKAVPHGGCWLVRGAHAHAHALTEADLVDAAAWIDVNAIVVHTPLAFPESKTRVALAAPEQNKSLRTILDDAIPPPSAKQQAFLRAARAGTQNKSAGIVGAAAALGAGAGFLGLLVGRLFAGWGTRPGTGRLAANGGKASKAGKARPAPDATWKQRLYAAAASLAMFTKMSKLIGWRQAVYLRKMVDMFERGDVAEALRHAIPLGADAQSERLALGAPSARLNLDITAPGGTTSVIGLDTETQNYLRKSYRQLFERLDREGRIDEATFVLAELLKCGVEAVDYLERHGRLKQAAQLAETLELAPEIAVRLWILAGDAARAVRIARLTGAFAEAVRLLERKQNQEAAPLRALWAEYLSDRGELTEAAEAIWPLEQYRSLALGWLLQAEQAGNVLGVRALVRKLALMPESLPDSLSAIATVLEAPGDEGVRLRAVLANELLAPGVQSGATSRLARETLRHVVAERVAGLNQLDKATLNKLLTLAGAGMLKSDLTDFNFGNVDAARPLASLLAPLQVHGGEPGLLPIHDARRLPGGHYLLALGESGVVRVTAQGRQVVHFPLPAYHLVLSQGGERALALARRGDVVRASRIDLTSCKVSDWISHPFDSWADQYDGVVWNAVIDNRLVAIDTTKDRLAVIWQVADLPGKVIDFYDDGLAQTILIAAGDELQQWRYALPARRLCQRDSVATPPADVAKVMAHPNSMGPMLCWAGEDAGAMTVSVQLPGWTRKVAIELGGFNAGLKVDIKDGWLVLQSQGPDGQYRCQVANRRAEKVVADIRIAHAQQAGVSAHDEHLLLFDRAGRLLDVDCKLGTVHSLALS
jgi:hypothetical protein